MCAGFVAKTQPAASNPQQTRRSLPKHLQTASDPDAQLGHSADPGWFASNILDFGPFAVGNQLKRKQAMRMHRSALPKTLPVDGSLLRLNLNLL
jgi:hypothetical protein